MLSQAHYTNNNEKNYGDPKLVSEKEIQIKWLCYRATRDENNNPVSFFAMQFQYQNVFNISNQAKKILTNTGV